MLTLAVPWLLALAPLPLLVYRLQPAYRRERAGVAVPFFERLARLTGSTAEDSRATSSAPPAQKIALLTCWLLTVVALARPQWLEPPITKTTPTRDLLLAVDLSGSMETKDFTNSKGEKVDRLTAVKEVLDDFLARRKGDRVGMIFFGSAAFVQTSFTEDLDACRTLLEEAQVRMAGPKTALGDAIGLAMTLFERESSVNERVLIALTDGNDTGSEVPPARAAQIAHDRKITIHTVAVGDPQAAGEEKLDEQALKDIASVTGGEFSRANDRNALAAIYTRLDALRTRPLETVTHRPRRDLFFWPLGAAFLVALTYHVLAASRAGSLAPVVHHTDIARAAALLAAAFALGAASDFHFLRPWWLAALVPAVALLWVMSRVSDVARGWRDVIESSLLSHLIVGRTQSNRWRPQTALAAVSLFSIVALAGPAWRREPAPFGQDESVLVIALKVTPTMLAKDVQPSRLTRAAEKISDLLKTRRGTRTALIAYAGSAHLVLPLTRDDHLISSFAAELTPEVLPKEGDAPDEALRLAQAQIEKSGAPGSILLVADDLPADVRPALEKFHQSGGVPVQIFAVAAPAETPVPPDSPPAPPLDLQSLESLASALDASVTPVTPDDSDLASIARHTVTRVVSTSGASTGDRWHDAGYSLSFLVALATLLWFRPGWFFSWTGGGA